jgi:hypothetical protein
MGVSSIKLTSHFLEILPISVPEMGNRYLRVILFSVGNICAMTMEHAKGRADVPHFTFEEIAA